MQARVERTLLRFLSKASGNVESVGKSDCRLPVSRWTPDAMRMMLLGPYSHMLTLNSPALYFMAP